jgi:acetoin utilization deacetylase AcuC-like enzyme
VDTILKAVEAVIAGEIDNAYCLVRPTGHHAERDRGQLNYVVLAM